MRKSAALLLMSIFAAAAARAVILLDTGDPAVNTTAPTGALANSGWQYEGIWGGFLGTPIAPHFFISAAHVGQSGGVNFSFQGETYTIVQSYSLPNSDLLIWKVREDFPSFAPVYSKRDELGQHLVDIGRGTERGSAITLNSTLRGWNWGNGTGVRRWGENDVSEIVPYEGHALLYATFDQHVQPNDRPNECHLSGGDSGGALFINDAGVWKLAGINFSVDDVFVQTSPPPSPSYTQLVAALFDARDYYTSDGNNPPTYTLISGSDPVSTGFYASQISSELAWIGGVLAEPQPGVEGNFLTFTYSRLIVPTSEVTYTVQQSDDLVSWVTATVAEEDPVSSGGDVERVRAKIDIGTSTTLFLRLQVTRPP
jgi:hypothetical protein